MQVAVAAFGSMAASTPAMPFSRGLTRGRMGVVAAVSPVRTAGTAFLSRSVPGIMARGRRARARVPVASGPLGPPSRLRVSGANTSLAAILAVDSVRSALGITAVGDRAISPVATARGVTAPRMAVSQTPSTERAVRAVTRSGGAPTTVLREGSGVVAARPATLRGRRLAGL